MKRVSLTAGEVASYLGASLQGASDCYIERLAPIDQAGPGDLAHLSRPAWRTFLDHCEATAVIVTACDAPRVRGTAIIVADPYLAYARISHWFDDAPPLAEGVSPAATVAADAEFGPGVAIGPGAHIGSGVQLGAGTLVGPNAVLEARVRLGPDCRVHAGAVIRHGVTGGARCVVQANAVVGADGFGYAPGPAGQRTAIAQLGQIRLGDDVEIGASTTLDRGALSDTVIADGVKIDNQVQIGHNVHIGRDTVICGCCGIAGGTVIGARCLLAGGVGVGGDGALSIADDVVISGMTHVSRSIEAPGVYSSGTLQQPTRRWKRNAILASRLDQLYGRVAELERALADSRSVCEGRH